MEMGAGHTPSDVVVYLPNEQVLFAADLVTGDFHPYLPDGNPESWTEILGGMSKWAIKWIVPGHGEVGQKNMILSTSKYISDIRVAANQLDVNTDTGSKDFRVSIPEVYKHWWLEQFYIDNVKFAFSRNAGK
jgi:cyclase